MNGPLLASPNRLLQWQGLRGVAAADHVVAIRLDNAAVERLHGQWSTVEHGSVENRPAVRPIRLEAESSVTDDEAVIDDNEIHSGEISEYVDATIVVRDRRIGDIDDGVSGVSLNIDAVCRKIADLAVLNQDFAGIEHADSVDPGSHPVDIEAAKSDYISRRGIDDSARPSSLG